MKERPSAFDQFLTYLFIITVLFAIGKSVHKYFYTKNYDYVVETSCDPQTERCFVRDCSGGDCPPNNLSTYRRYTIKAYDFPKCSDNSCKSECESGAIACEPISCDEAAGDACTVTE